MLGRKKKQKPSLPKLLRERGSYEMNDVHCMNCGRRQKVMVPRGCVLTKPVHKPSRIYDTRSTLKDKEYGLPACQNCGCYRLRAKDYF